MDKRHPCFGMETMEHRSDCRIQKVIQTKRELKFREHKLQAVCHRTKSCFIF